MSIALSIAPNQTITISEQRLGRMLSGDKNKATHLGLWERIKDFFLPEKKKDALNALYDLVYGPDNAPNNNEQPLANRILSFEKIKNLAEPDYQKLFKVEENENLGTITFTVNDVVITQKEFAHLSREDQLFFDAYRTEQLNINRALQNRFEESAQEQVNDAITKNPQASNLSQLNVDLPRMRVQFDGYDMFTADGVPEPTKKERLNNFLDKLSPQQKVALNILGTQTAAADVMTIVDTVSKKYNFAKASTSNLFDVDPTGNLVINTVLTVDMPDELFQEYRNRLEQDFRYPQQSAQTTFLVSKEGKVTCVGLNITNHANSILSTNLATPEPELFTLLTYLKKVVKETDVAWEYASKRASDTSAEAKNAFYCQALMKRIDACTPQEKQQILANLSGPFGVNLTSLLEFAVEQVGKNSDDPRLISTVMNYANLLSDTTVALRAQISPGKPADGVSIEVSDFSEVEHAEAAALLLIGLTPELLQGNPLPNYPE